MALGESHIQHFGEPIGAADIRDFLDGPAPRCQFRRRLCGTAAHCRATVLLPRWNFMLRCRCVGPLASEVTMSGSGEKPTKRQSNLPPLPPAGAGASRAEIAGSVSRDGGETEISRRSHGAGGVRSIAGQNRQDRAEAKSREDRRGRSARPSPPPLTEVTNRQIFPTANAMRRSALPKNSKGVKMGTAPGGAVSVARLSRAPDGYAARRTAPMSTLSLAFVNLHC